MKKVSEHPPSSNWLALQKKTSLSNPRKRRKIDHHDEPYALNLEKVVEPVILTSESDEIKNGESVNSLRKMILGDLDARYTDHQRIPGKYLALDCEMVGVGTDGKESSLARVSLVNYYGAVQLDEFVQQRERVVDYRTEFSGVRPRDMINAKSFQEIQKEVADLLKGRMLVGHAVFNDLKALLLSHPGPETRDTQQYAYKHKLVKTRHPALRNLVQHEFNITIQGGEHSSITDARATMAIYRVYRRLWEKGNRLPLTVTEQSIPTLTRKRKRDTEQGANFPGGGKKGVSSGLSAVVKQSRPTSSRRNAHLNPNKSKTKWWAELGTGAAKGSLKLTSRSSKRSGGYTADNDNGNDN